MKAVAQGHPVSQEGLRKSSETSHIYISPRGNLFFYKEK